MKCTRHRYGIAGVLFLTLVLNACKKEESTQVPELQNDASQVKLSGVIPDDPALVNKVPMIMSADFLKQSKGFKVTSIVNGRARPDITLPTVSITSPSSSAIVSGAIIIQVSASDNVGVSMVSVSVDGSLVANSSTSPYTFLWNSATVSNATHTITATAKDAAGNSKTASIQVSVNNTTTGDITKPLVSITSPADGGSVSGTVNVAVSASDNVGVGSVEFDVDGAKVGTSTTSPYSFSWNTTSVASGTHTLMAVAKDAAGNSAAASVNITINTTVIPPATLPSSVLLVMPPVGYQGSEGCCVSFAAAYAARSCEQYYRTNATSYSLSTNIFSPEFVFNQVQSGSCAASSLLTTLDLIVNKGVCSWATMPYSYNDGCSLQPTASQLSAAANYKITSYSRVYTTDITAMKTSLSNKHPLMMTFANDNNFNNAGPGYIWKSYDASGGYGGHAITICGYDDSRHAYKAINSWGTTWGDAGYIWIDYDFLPSVASSVYLMN